MEFTRCLILGNIGEDVLAVQIALNRYYGKKVLETDGVFSPELFGAIWKWKQEYKPETKHLSGIVNEEVFNKIVNEK